jgi:hypothetical protein
VVAYQRFEFQHPALQTTPAGFGRRISQHEQIAQVAFESNFHVSQAEVPIDTPPNDDQKSKEYEKFYHLNSL